MHCGELAQVARPLVRREPQGAQRAAIRGDRQSAAHQQAADVHELNHGRRGLGVAIEIGPRLEQVNETFRSAHGRHLFQIFMASPLATVTPIDTSATSRCSRRLSALFSASFDSFAPV